MSEPFGLAKVFKPSHFTVMDLDDLSFFRKQLIVSRTKEMLLACP
jgi:hypothetical protein